MARQTFKITFSSEIEDGEEKIKGIIGNIDPSPKNPSVYTDKDGCILISWDNPEGNNTMDFLIIDALKKNKILDISITFKILNAPKAADFKSKGGDVRVSWHRG